MKSTTWYSTNYPFSQKTDYSEFYGLETEDANPVFLKHVIDALRDGGRAGVIVPDGLLFDTKAQYVKVRRTLLEQCRVIAVIKLHPFVFRPYTGQPTSILIFEKGQPTDRVWFFGVREDGFKKTSSKHGRPPIVENDLLTLRQFWPDKIESDQSYYVDFETIQKSQYKLSTNTYAERHISESWVRLGGPDGLCEVHIGGTPPTRDSRNWGGPHPWVTISDMTDMYITETARTLSDAGAQRLHGRLLPKGTVLLSFKLSVGRVAIAGRPVYTNEAIAGLIPKDGRVLPKYLYWLLPSVDYSGYEQPATKGMTLNKGSIESIRIPLPTQAEQQKFIRSMDKKGAAQQRLRKRAEEIAEDADALARQQFVTE